MTNFETTFKKTSEIDIIASTGTEHVVVLAGGMSAEREVSLSSSVGVIKALVNLGYRVTKVDMGADISTILSEIKPDKIFNCLHGTYGEDGCVPGLLNIMRIPYTHSGLLSSAIAFDKERSREIFLAHNINCASAVYVKKADNLKIDPMARPYVIKPLTQGSSVGVRARKASKPHP